MVPSRNTEQFIKAAKKKHGDTYIYDAVKYKNSTTKVSIICRVHGEFTQTPPIHLKGSGCNKCALDRAAQTNKLSRAEFIDKCNKAHGNYYIYDNTVYTNSKSKIAIICPEHGEFWQIASNHVNGGGCSQCTTNPSYDTTEFIRRATTVHNNTYMYDKTVYTKSSDKVTITCKIHGEFSQRASAHLLGQGCPMCNMSTGFDQTKPGILYYIKINSPKVPYPIYKIGITNLSVEKRFTGRELAMMTVLSITEYAVGAHAYREEQRILKQYEEYTYKGISILSSGNTELFIKDVLEKE
jgi:hypothetical protein